MLASGIVSLSRSTGFHLRSNGGVRTLKQLDCIVSVRRNGGTQTLQYESVIERRGPNGGFKRKLQFLTRTGGVGVFAVENWKLHF